MPIETISITVTGANPQTKNVQISVDPNTGSGSGTVTFSAANGGFDAAQGTATISGNPYTSNVANLAWQATNGVVSLINAVTLQAFQNPGNTTTWHGIGSALTGVLGPYNSVIVNQVVNNTPISGLVTPDGNSGEYKLVPPHIDLVTNTGTALTANGTALPYSGSFVTFFHGKIVVSTAGVHTFYFLADDSFAMYLGPNTVSGQQPTRVQGAYTLQPNGSSPATPLTADLAFPGDPAWPLMGTRNTSASQIQQTDYIYVNFPSPGVYPFMVWWVNNADGQAYLQMTATPGQGVIPPSNTGTFGSVIKPVALQANPSATTPAGNLQLSLANGNFHVVGDSTTLNVSVNGINYPTKPYIPVLEGVAGNIAIYNSASLNQFNFQTYNGQPVDKPTAASAAFGLVGDNTAWQGRVSVVFDGTNFQLNYNGQPFVGGTATTQLTLTADDIAWFNSVTKTYDVFAASVGGGGLVYNIEVDYMISASVASVTPSTVVADGGQHVFTVNLTKPLSPQQQGAFNTGNTVTISTSWSGGVVTNSVTPNVDGSGFLTGWNVTATVSASTVNVSVTLNATIQGNLTRLVGTVFTTGNVVYVNNATIATITLQGAALLPPVAYSFSIAPKSGSAPNFTVSGATTLTATVYNPTNVSNTVVFYQRQNGTSNTINLGTGTLSSSYTGVVNGQTVYFKVYTLNHSWTAAGYAIFNLGFIATDQNNLAVTYWDPNTYTNPNVGGGGGGGCPTLDMFVDDWHQVSDAFVGMGLDALVGLGNIDLIENIVTLPSTETVEIISVDFSSEICYRFVTENGAEVTVSGSTPVPTRESIVAIAAHGQLPGETPIFASYILAGMHLITDVGNGPEWSRIVETECVGEQKVARLFCGGRNFAAGKVPGKYIYTHNLPPVVK